MGSSARFTSRPGAPTAARRDRTIVLAIVLVCAIVLALMPATAAAVSGDRLWVENYDRTTHDDMYYDCVRAPDGGVYAVGWAGIDNAGDGADVLLARYDAAGTRVWQRVMFSPSGGRDEAYEARTDRDGNLILGGIMTPATGRDVVTAKWDPTGASPWSALYNRVVNDNDNFGGLALDGAGNAYVVSSGGTGDTGIAIVKYGAADGAQRWVRMFDRAGLDEGAQDIDVDRAGNSYVVGSAENAAGGYDERDFLIVKTSAGGKPLWTRKLNGAKHRHDLWVRVVVTRRGVFVAGWTGLYKTLTVARYSTAGRLLWKGRIPSPVPGNGREDYVNGLGVDGQGNMFVAGTRIDPGESHALLAKWSLDGRRKWLRIYAPTAQQAQLSDLVVSRRGTVWCCGWTGMWTDANWLVMRYTASGARRWARTYDLQAKEDSTFALALSGTSSLYVCGYAHYPDGDTAATIARYER